MPESDVISQHTQQKHDMRTLVTVRPVQSGQLRLSSHMGQDWSHCESHTQSQNVRALDRVTLVYASVSGKPQLETHIRCTP